MLNFVTGCVGLFGDTLNATMKLEFFQFIIGFLVLDVSLLVYLVAKKTVRKM